MALDPYQVGYFITQVGLSAASFGVTKEDVTAVGMALNKLFNYKCSPATTVVKSQGNVLESICIADNCPQDPAPTCDKYEKVVAPKNATSSGGSSSSSASSSAGSTATSSGGAASSTAKPAGASSLQAGSLAAAAGALFAFAL